VLNIDEEMGVLMERVVEAAGVPEANPGNELGFRRPLSRRGDPPHKKGVRVQVAIVSGILQEVELP
jgi:hypothetical protein